MRQIKIVNDIQVPSVRSVNALEPGTFFKDLGGNLWLVLPDAKVINFPSLNIYQQTAFQTGVTIVKVELHITEAEN